MSRSSNWHKPNPRRSVDDAASSRHELGDEKWSTGAPEHQSTRAPVDESRFRSRSETEMVRGRIPIQKARKFKLFCAINEKDIQNALEEAVDDLLAKYEKFSGALEHQSTTINDFDDLNDDAKRNLFDPSSSQSPESGAPEHQSLIPEQEKAKRMMDFYAKKTGNQVKQRDYDSFLKVADSPEHAIRGGVLKSIILCRQRVNSFEYCVGAIEEITESGVGVEFVEYLETKLRAKQRGLPGAGGELKEGEFRK